MDKFYHQFFGSDQYPPDKKERPESTGSDELDSTVDDGASHAGPSKYDDLQSLNLGPPLDGDVKAAPEPALSPTPHYHSQKQKRPAEPRDTYIRADAGDGFIKPKQPVYDADMWPPSYEETPAAAGKPSLDDEEKFVEDKKPRYPRITYNPADMDEKRKPPRGRSPPRRARSPPRQDRSPPRRARSPPRQDRSPPRRDRSPMPRDRSPPRRDRSPMPRDRSPPRRDRSPMPRDRSPPPPRRHDGSPPPHRRRRGSPPPHDRRPDSPPRRYDEKQRMPSPGRRPDMRPPPDRRHTPPHGRYDEKHPHRPPGGPPDRDRRQAQGVISPYIGKWAKLSRVWTSQTVIMIVFMAVGYMLMADAARRMAADTAAGMLAACGALDSAANHVVNAPNQAALSMLGLLTEGALDVVRLAEKTLIQIIDIFRDIIVWVLKLYVGTFICFAELIIRTALAMVAEASKLLTEALNKALDSVMPVLQNVAATVAGGVQDAANKVIGFFGGGGDNGPKVDFKPDDIRKELNVQIPTDWVDSISSLQDKIPTEQELFGDFTAVLDIPFSFIRNALTAAFASVHIDFVDGVNLPLDKKANVCEGPMGQDVILEMGDVVAKIFFFGGLLMLGVAAGIMLFNAFMVMRREKRFQTRLVEFRHELIEYDPPQSARAIAERPATRREMDMFVLPGSPWLDRFTKMLVRKMGNGERAAAWRWWLHYVWHPPAIACFIAGAIGLLSILGQIYAINTLRHEYVPRLARELTEFQVSLGAKLIAPVRDESVALTGGINGNVSAKEGDLNRTMFGPVNDGTSKVNDTLNEFVKSYIDGIRKTFGGTPLQQPIEGLVNCTLTRNIQSIQKVIGYVNGFASGFHLPRISEDVLLNPVEKLIRPLNATAQNFREFAVGYYIPHADRLDPNSFPELDEEAMLSSKEAKIQSMAEKYKNEHPTAGTPTTAPTPSASSNSEPGQAGAHRKRQQSGLDGGSQEPRATQDSSGRGQSAAQHPSSSAESSGELGELGDDDADDAFLYNLAPVPTSELYRQDIVDAQEYDGFTGGVLGKLLDSYIKRLKEHIPLMVTLMSVWVIIAIMGAFNVIRDLRRVKKMRLK